MELKDMHLETKALHAGYSPKNGEPRVLPIVQSTTFKYESSEAMAKLFDLEAEGYFYTRLQNPTNDAVAAKIAALEVCKNKQNNQTCHSFPLEFPINPAAAMVL